MEAAFFFQKLHTGKIGISGQGAVLAAGRRFPVFAGSTALVELKAAGKAGDVVIAYLL